MTFSRRVLLLCLGAPLLGVLLAAGTRGLLKQSAAGTPALECVDGLDLGDHEQGSIAFGFFDVGNVGGGELRLGQFRTSCSCAGIERNIDGEYVPVQSVRLRAGEKVQLAVRIAVGARPGHSQTIRVGFETNDPARAFWNIDAVIPHVKGGVYVEPAAVDFGAVTLGAHVARIVDVYDNGTTGRRIDSVRSTSPESFTVQLLLPPEGARVRPPVGQIIGRVAVLAKAVRPGPFGGDVEIRLADAPRQPDRLQVAGEVVGEVKWLPHALILPRRAGKALSYSGQLIVFSRSGAPIQLAVDPPARGISVDVQPIAERRDRVIVRIKLDGVRASGPQILRSQVRMVAVSDARRTPIEIPVLVTGGQR